MSLVIRGLATATPTYAADQSEAAEIAKMFVGDDPEHAELLPTLFQMSKVRRRGSVVLDAPRNGVLQQSFYPPTTGPDDRGPTTETRMHRFIREAVPLAVEASRRAIDQAGISPRRITQLITVSCTGFSSPGVDIAMIKQLELSPSVGRTQIGFMGCHGALNGLRVAQAFADADSDSKVLVCCVELCSLHYSYGWDPKKVVANALFADGAAALVATSENGHSGRHWRVAASGSVLLPETENDMTWRIGDHGFEMTLSARVPKLIEQYLRPWLVDWLGSHGLRLEDVNAWAIHPGGPRIIARVVRALDLPDSAAKAPSEILAEHGNMSSATVLFVVQRLQKLGERPPAVALAFGPGLVAEAALFLES